MKEIHGLLTRQVRRHFGGLEAVPESLAGFLELVNDAYLGFDADRKMLERSLDLSSDELLQANLDMRAVLQAFPDLFLRLRSDGTVLERKSGRVDASSARPEYLPGTKVQDLPDDEVGLAYYAALRQVRESGAVVRIEYGVPTPDGEVFYEARFVPLLDDQVIVIVRDVTERRDAQDAIVRSRNEMEERVRARTEELRRAKEAAEAADRAKSAFLASMSHELRTPLSAVIGFAELIQERVVGDLTAKQEEYVRIIEDSGRHLLSLINEILDLAKVEAGTAVLECAPAAITTVLEHTLTLFKEKCLKHRIVQHLRVHDEAQGIIVTLDERKFRQIVFNLLSNAVKFTPDGGRVEIEVALLPDPGETAGDVPPTASRLPALQVSVMDTGIGIPVEQHEAVFEAFHQIRHGTSDKTPGTGLGLALVRRMVELHGGRVWVESEGEGRGSTFRFTIPLHPEARSEASGKALDGTVAPGGAPRPTQERMAELIAQYRETIGSFSIGRLRPASKDVRVDCDTVLQELETAKRSGDSVLVDPERNFVLLLRADLAAAHVACRRLSARLESRLGVSWAYTVAAYPDDGQSAEELTGALQRTEESAS